MVALREAIINAIVHANYAEKGAPIRVAVERWLRGLRRADTNPMASATKAKIRNLMSVLFNHAIRYEWVEQGKNPITLVRQSAKRIRIPEGLEPREIQTLWLQLNSCFRLMVILDVTTGLRRSELFALKWGDVDFAGLRLDILRSIYLPHIYNCKTEASRKPVPLEERGAADLWLWKETSPYRQADDWVFASPHNQGKHPFWPDAVLQKVLRPAALRAGINKRIGWHKFRKTLRAAGLNGSLPKLVGEGLRPTPFVKRGRARSLKATAALVSMPGQRAPRREKNRAIVGLGAVPAGADELQ